MKGFSSVPIVMFDFVVPELPDSWVVMLRSDLVLCFIGCISDDLHPLCWPSRVYSFFQRCRQDLSCMLQRKCFIISQ